MGRYFWLTVFELTLIALVSGLLFRFRLLPKKSSQLTYSQQSAQKPESFLESAVLGSEDAVTPIISPTVSTPVLSFSPTPTPIQSSYQIMLFGDSMEETMGPSASPLWQSLRKRYPQTAFSIINNSRGAENVESALERLEKLLPNLIIPDIVIVGSYAYNPFVPHSLSKHTQFLTELLTKFKQTGSKVYLLAEIAPAKNLFGSKLAGLNWDDAWRYTQSTNVIALLENALKVATKLEVEVVDVYHDSIVGADKSGDIRYISSEDYLHPSVLGHQFTAAKIAEELDLN